jgi:3-hydroxyacyl-[acyl-carrier-protein] dehydratase
MPGVLIVEAMAQCAAILGLREMPDREKKLFLFGGVDKARFRKPVVPGDQLQLECVVLHRRSTSVKIHGKATVDGQLVAEAELFSVLIDRPE